MASRTVMKQYQYLQRRENEKWELDKEHNNLAGGVGGVGGAKRLNKKAIAMLTCIARRWLDDGLIVLASRPVHLRGAHWTTSSELSRCRAWRALRPPTQLWRHYCYVVSSTIFLLASKLFLEVRILRQRKLRFYGVVVPRCWVQYLISHVPFSATTIYCMYCFSNYRSVMAIAYEGNLSPATAWLEIMASMRSISVLVRSMITAFSWTCSTDSVGNILA